MKSVPYIGHLLSTHTWNLPSYSSSYFRFRVFQEFHERWYKVPSNTLFINSFGYLYSLCISIQPLQSLSGGAHLLKSISHHVSHPPALVFKQTS